MLIPPIALSIKLPRCALAADKKVTLYGNGKETAFRINREEELNCLLDAFRSRTAIPVGKV